MPWERRLVGGGLVFDYARHRLSGDALTIQIERLENSAFDAAKKALFFGESVNTTEQRTALHSLLRARQCPTNDSEILGKYQNIVHEKHRFSDVATRIRAGTYPSDTPITDVVNIGIGGSDLGPRLMVQALDERVSSNIRYHAISNIDPAAWHQLQPTLTAETTLIVLVSKSFKTQETLTNGALAMQWLQSHLGDRTPKHVFGVTASPDRAQQFGIQSDHIFKLWDWVGGRFSLWSAVSFAAVCAIGPETFERFLQGAATMDQHFLSSPPAKNIPVIMACLTDYYRNQEALQSHAVIPYAEKLAHLPAYLQQLEMESLGKRVDRDGRTLETDTGAILWGQAGTNGQHAFHQLLHQGTTAVPADFILIRKGPEGLEHQQKMLVANCLAQADALAFGQTHVNPHQHVPGNKPVSIFGVDALTPEALGALIAAYEHKVFTLGHLWKINPFDQYGVELGKQLCDQYLTCLTDSEAEPPQSIHPWILWACEESEK